MTPVALPSPGPWRRYCFRCAKVTAFVLCHDCERQFCPEHGTWNDYATPERTPVHQGCLKRRGLGHVSRRERRAYVLIHAVLAVIAGLGCARLVLATGDTFGRGVLVTVFAGLAVALAGLARFYAKEGAKE